eukprot:scaffold2760_cov167-Amphora_coffeaeformis.AAC.9
MPQNVETPNYEHGSHHEGDASHNGFWFRLVVVVVEAVMDVVVKGVGRLTCFLVFWDERKSVPMAAFLFG